MRTTLCKAYRHVSDVNAPNLAYSSTMLQMRNLIYVLLPRIFDLRQHEYDNKSCRSTCTGISDELL